MVSRIFERSLKGASRKVQWCFKKVSKIFKEVSKVCLPEEMHGNEKATAIAENKLIAKESVKKQVTQLQVMQMLKEMMEGNLMTKLLI